MQRMPPTSFRQRSSGLLMHITCLPGPHGSGDLSSHAMRFVDFLAAAGQRWWQMLPINPPGDHPGNSPYSSTSSLAGSPLLISLEGLVKDGLLKTADIPPLDGRADAVDFARVRQYRGERLRRAYAAFVGSRARLRRAFEAFCQSQAHWLDDFALFTALKHRLGARPWWQWNPTLATRSPDAVRTARAELAEDIRYEQFLQFVFDRQWRELRTYANGKGVGLIGDIPIFVGHDSADVWAHRDLFQLDAGGRPQVVSGYPPDTPGEKGQKWGHPLYKWKKHEATGYAWWVQRFASLFDHFDAVRIDHFLGFLRLYAIPAQSPDARVGRWIRSPGRQIFEHVRAALGDRPVIAEDLGRPTPGANELRDDFGFLGMRILQFGFGDTYHLPHRYPRMCAAYTGTHDSDTCVGWFRSIRPASRRRRVLQYIGGEADSVARDMIRTAMGSVASTVIIPVQDVLGLDGKARFNVPGTPTGNWTWRMRPGALSPAMARDLHTLTLVTERLAPVASDETPRGSTRRRESAAQRGSVGRTIESQ